MTFNYNISGSIDALYKKGYDTDEMYQQCGFQHGIHKSKKYSSTGIKLSWIVEQAMTDNIADVYFYRKIYRDLVTWRRVDTFM
jgi:hypothetical protein